MNENIRSALKLIQLKGIICSADRVSIRLAGFDVEPEDNMIRFRDAVERYGDSYVWWIEADSSNCFNITVNEDE